MMFQRPLRALKPYGSGDTVPLPSLPQASLQLLLPIDKEVPAGPQEHAVDGYHLRSEGALINDFRDDVADPDAAKKSRRRPNCAVVPVVIGGQAHTLIFATEAIAQGREVLLDYGEQHWRPWNGTDAGTQQQTNAPATTAGDDFPHLTDACDDLAECADAHVPDHVRQMEAHEPLDRKSAREATQTDGAWDWADGVSEVPPSTLDLPLQTSACTTSIAALSLDNLSDPNAEFPAFIKQLIKANHRHRLMESVKAWLAAGGGSPKLAIGRLISSTHPAVAAAAKHASARYGVKGTQLGMFAKDAIPPLTILCEYQGVRISWPVGCNPWLSAVPDWRSSYLMGATQAEKFSAPGIRRSLAALPTREMHTWADTASGSIWASEEEDWLDIHVSLAENSSSSDESESNEEESDGEEADDADKRLQITLIYAKHRPEKLAKLDSLLDKYGASLLLKYARVKYESTSDTLTDVEAVAEQRRRLQAVRRRRMWTSQLFGFVAAPEETRAAVSAVARQLMDTKPNGGGHLTHSTAALVRERASFAWCIKYDALCPGPASLKGEFGLDLTVIEGVLRLFDEYGITLPALLLDCGSDSHQASCVATTYGMQVLGPALAGLQHNSAPNLLLVADSGGGVRATATRAIEEGELLTCDFCGHCRLPEKAYVVSSAGCKASKELAALINMAREGWPSADQRLQFNKITEIVGSGWVAYAARSVLLRAGIDCEAHARELVAWLVGPVGMAQPCAHAYVASILRASPHSPQADAASSLPLS